MSRRLRVGDVVDVKHPTGYGYVQFLGRHDLFGDAVAVSPRLHLVPQEIGAPLFRDAYVAFYPVSHTVRNDMAEFVGSLPPVTAVPEAYRRDARPFEDDMSRWVIDGPVRVDASLIPYGEIWNHPMLLHQLETGWTPDVGFKPVQRPPPRPRPEVRR